jgi:hypothetical protein
MIYRSDRGSKLFRFASIFLFVFATNVSAQTQDHDSWIYNKAKAEDKEVIIKWCSRDGARVAYSLSQPKDFEQCGKLETAVYCDPAGNKYMGSGKPPYAYQDCSLGPRIQVVKTIPAGEYKAPANSSDDYTWKVSSKTAKTGNEGSYFQMLDGLLGGFGTGSNPSKFENQPIGHKDQRPTKGPFAPSSMVKQVGSQDNQSGSPLEHILDQLADDK